MAAQEDKNFIVETHSIDFIPPNLRHGKASDLLFLWFGANCNMAVFATGLIVMVPNFGLGWAILGIIVGTLIGSIFMAFHSAQGPHLGIPQMIQSRAQFGYFGAIVPLIMVVVMYLGFFAAGAVIGADAIARITHLSVTDSLLLSSVGVFLLVLTGYNMIHWVNRIMSYIYIVVFLILTAVVLASPPNGPHATSHPVGFLLGPFLLSVSLAVINTLAYAPYVADYSRYLPEETTVRSTFWYSYIGVAVSNMWMMILGAMIALRFVSQNPVSGLAVFGKHVDGFFMFVVLLVAGIGIITINSLNIYGGFMSSLTTLSTFFPKWKANLSLRLWFIIPFTVVGTYLGYLAESNILNGFEAFLTLLIDFLVPWTAINLTDYYLVRRGQYSVPNIFNPDGIYGRINTWAFVAYFGGFLAEMPFMNTLVYEGPVAKLLSNGDISWIPGVIVSGLIYLIASRRYLVSSPYGIGESIEDLASRTPKGR